MFMLSFDKSCGNANSSYIHELVNTSNQNSNLDIYSTMNDGTEMLDLIETTDGDITSAWSRDGKMNTFTSGMDGPRQIFTINTDSSKQKKGHDRRWSNGNPEWRA